MLRQAGFVVPASEPENENFSDIDDEIVVERSLVSLYYQRDCMFLIYDHGRL